MKKSDFVDSMSQQLNLSKKETNDIVDCFLGIIVQTLKKGDEVVFPIGKFVLKKRPAREGINALTGKAYKTPAKVVPAFRPNKKFKEQVVA